MRNGPSLNLFRRAVAWFVSELAAPELALGRPRLAAVRTPGDRPEHERVLRALRATLGDAELRRLREEGAAMPLEEAVSLALCSPDAGTRTSPCAQARSAA